MQTLKHALRAALFTAALTPLLAHAQMPPAQTAGGVTYVTGGIGSDEVASMQAEAKNYSVMIEFVELEAGSQHGNWTADVSVDVKYGNQTLTSIAVTGPLLLLRLAPGRYSLDATHGDVKLNKVIEIKPNAKPSRERFVWMAAAGSLGSNLRSDPAKN
jgi:hypothetical protein